MPGTTVGGLAVTALVCCAPFPCRRLQSGSPDRRARPAVRRVEAGPTRTVARVIDGETVALDDGTRAAPDRPLAPRAIDAGAEPGTWPLELAAQEELRALVFGKSIALAFDRERSDRYGRLQAHAFWLEGARGAGCRATFCSKVLRAPTGKPAIAPAPGRLSRPERMAREARRGLWGDAAFLRGRRICPASCCATGARFRWSRAGSRGSRTGARLIYLNFGDNRRGVFGLAAARRPQASRALADDPKALEGRLVRVRGWIEQRNAAPSEAPSSICRPPASSSVHLAPSAFPPDFEELMASVGMPDEELKSALARPLQWPQHLSDIRRAARCGM